MPAPPVTTASPAALPTLHRVLRQVMARIRLRRAVVGGANGLLFGAAVAGIAAVLLRLGVYDEDTLPDIAFFLPPGVGLTAGTLWGGTRHLQPFAAARLIEERLDFKERLSSALALLSGTEDAFSLRQRADAEAHAKKIDPTMVVPLTPIPRRVVAALAAAVAVFLVWLLPTLAPFQSPSARNDRIQVKKEGERLVRIAKAIDRTSGAKKLEASRKAASQLAKLGTQMQTGRMPRRKALIKVAKLTGQIKQSQKNLAAQTGDPNSLGAGKSLPSAGRDLQKALDAAQKSGSMQGLTPPAEKGKSSSSPNGQKKLADAAMQASQKALSENNISSLAEQLNKIADTVARGEPKEAKVRQAMAAQLDALSKALQGTQLEDTSAHLAEAAKSIQSGDMPRAAEKLREAARKAAEAGAKTEDAQALAQMAQALQGSPDGDGTQQNVSAEQMAQASSGENAGDAFDADGSRKGAGNGEGNDSGKQGPNGSGEGKGKEPANGIGSGAGKVGGERVVGKAGAYTDPRTAPAGNKNLNRKMQTAPVTTDKGLRLTVPAGNTTRVAGKRGEKGREMVSYTQGAPDKASASVPYYEVYGKYAPAAEKALSREDIPAAYKKQVKEYFDALRPSGQGKQ